MLCNGSRAYVLILTRESVVGSKEKDNFSIIMVIDKISHRIL